MRGNGSLVGRSRIFVAALAATATVVLGVAAPASAGTLDQQQPNQVNGPALFGPGDGPQSLAQTFTAGIGGSLDQVDLSLDVLGNPPSPITVEIRSTVGGVPGPLSAVLATAGVPTAGLAAFPNPAFVSVPITPALPVTAGTQYAIVAYNNGAIGNAVGWGEVSAGNPYTRGTGYINTASFPPDSGWNDAGGGIDRTFKTYVVPATCKGRQATVIGTAGNDSLNGTAGIDVVAALAGKDKVRGLGGNDLICGGTGKDNLKGGGGKDTLLGEGGKDRLSGGGGKDVCKGGKGKDAANCEVEKSVP
jgi:hypothetical protein